MEKTLHGYFCINTGEELKFYSAKDSSFLVEAANFHIERGKGNNDLNTLPELDAIIYECMEEYYKNGLTDDLLNKLNEILMNVRIQCLLENMENKLSAIHVAYIPKNPSPVVFGAYMFSHVTSLGGLEGLKRCYNKGCLNFFIGRSNAKWCSSACGSKYRVSKMRRNKRAA